MDYLQVHLETGVSSSTSKVYVVTIAVEHVPVGNNLLSLILCLEGTGFGIFSQITFLFGLCHWF